MLNLALAALDRIIDLLRIREKRMQKRFDQIWKPTYTDLQSVHADYYSMFQTVHSLLSQGVKQEEGGASYDRRYDKAIQFIKQQRVAFAPIRQKLIALDQIAEDEGLLDTLSEPERHFLAEVTDYIRLKSLPDAVGTRSAELQHEMEAMARMDEFVADGFVANVERLIGHLGEDWINVSRSFNALQIALIQKSN